MASMSHHEGHRKRSIELGWTDEVVAQLRQWWLEGESVREIGRRWGFSASKVIGKLHRLGLNDQSRPSSGRTQSHLNHPKTAKPKKLPAPPKLRVLKRNGEGRVGKVKPPTPTAPQGGPGLATILSLGPHMCRWPMDATPTEEFTFCGQQTDGTYCKSHAKRAFLPGSTARDLERSVRRCL